MSSSRAKELIPIHRSLFQHTISSSDGMRAEVDTSCEHSAATMCDASEAALMAGIDW
jgi:hypothetical protein